MNKIRKLIVKYRVAILALGILLLIPSAMGYLKTRVNYDILYYLPDDIETMKGQDILQEDFGKGAFAMEIKQRESQILDKINTYFGYKAVSKLKIVQNSCPENFLIDKKPIDNMKKNLVSKEEQNYITEIVKDIDNSDLRQKLENLGKAAGEKVYYS